MRIALSWYEVTDSIYKREMLENRGQQALIDVAGKMASRLQESMEHPSKEVWCDGDEAGNELRFHGIEFMMATDGTVGIDDGVGRAANAADMLGWPADNYAGINTGLGAVAGSQLEGVWPNGVADPEYDFYSPIVVNYTSTASAATGKILALGLTTVLLPLVRAFIRPNVMTLVRVR